ncbi:hypothetical protein [Kitasatospora sp. NBC_01266]|jgi:hypothetical protein|nr:hypothetical protein [Kitasatospora sp. NBC_01266]
MSATAAGALGAPVELTVGATMQIAAAGPRQAADIVGPLRSVWTEGFDAA